jgi:hypothetical protein
MMLLLSHDLKLLHDHEYYEGPAMAVKLGVTGVTGYSLGTFIARRMPFLTNPRKFIIARVGIISLLSWVRLLNSFP